MGIRWVYLKSVIGGDGNISNIRMRGPNKNLENESNRIISKLPKMPLGIHRGKAIWVPLSIPVTFKLQ